MTVTLAHTVAGRTSTEVVQRLVLAGQSSQTVHIPAHGDPAMTNSLIVRSSLPPGNVVSQFIAWGDFQVRSVELQAKDNDSVQNGGGHPWTIAQGADSTLLLFNHSLDGPKKFEVLVGNGKQLWVGSYELASNETKAVKINEIIERQIPDAKGVKLSKDILSGQVGWWTHRAKWGKGRLMVSQPLTGMARSFSCGTCAALCLHGSIDPFSSVFIGFEGFGSLGDFSIKQCLATCGQCGGTLQGPGSGFITWSSSNTSIATLNSGQHSTTASFQGVGPGGASGNAQATDEGCIETVAGPITVAPAISPAQGLIGTTLTGVTISGRGFGSNPTVSGGSGITVTTTAKSDTSITATFAISAAAAGGNNPITVTTTAGIHLPAVNFYVQIPKTMIRDTSYGTNGLGSLVTITNGNVLDIYGQVLASGECGVYRNVGYLLVDQESPARTLQCLS